MSAGGGEGPVLATTYLGLPLTGPVIASSSPLTREIETLKELERAGAAAVVLPSMFEEEVIAEEMAFHESVEQTAGFDAEFTDMMPEMTLPDLGPERHLRRLEQAKQALSVPVIASLNAVHTGSWQRYAQLFVDAGADALELNLYAVAANPAESAADVETRYLDVIGEVRENVSVPLAVKLSPYFSSLAHFAGQVAAAGVDGLVVFNRFYAPDIDLESLHVEPSATLSSSVALRLPLRWLAILRGQLPQVSLAATSGVHGPDDVIKAILVGANVACTASAVLQDGPQAITAMLAGVRSWLAERDYTGVDQARGSLSAVNVEDPSAFERSQYIEVLTSFGTQTAMP